jgi:hypothetical protein
MHGTQKLELYYRDNLPGTDEICWDPPVIPALALELQFAGVAFIPFAYARGRHTAPWTRNLKNLHTKSTA